MIHEIRVPQLGVNDSSAELVAKIVDTGAFVRKGAELCVFETTKATFSVYAPDDGYIKWLETSSKTVAIQQTVAVLGLSREETEAYAPPQLASNRLVRMTKKADALVQKYSLKVDALPLDFSRTIREADLTPFIPVCESVSALQKPAVAVGAKQIAVFNATGGGCAVAEACLSAGLTVVCLIDDVVCRDEQFLLGIPVVSLEVFIERFRASVEAVFVHLQRDRKRIVIERFAALGLPSPTVIHPSASVSSRAILGEGVMVKSGAVIDIGTVIHEHTLVDNGVVIPHDCTIGRYCHLAPGACMGGNVTIGDGCVIGIGAVISPEISIGRGSVLLPGCVVRTDVAPFSMMDGIDNCIGKSKEMM